MEKWMVLILVMIINSNSQAYSQEHYGDLRIDCGASTETPATNNGLVLWLTDDKFIETGENNFVIYSQNFSTMNSLRYFPHGEKNCYYLPISGTDIKYLFRAGFYYGNYDDLSKPPSFNLEIDGNFWTTVTASTIENGPINYEMIHKINGDSARVCLVRTTDGIPFISSLEATQMSGNDMYRLMENKTALLLESRINYGANNSIEKFTREDFFNRIWKSKKMSEYLNIDDGRIVDGQMYGENNPPWSVMQSAIQAKNVSESIYLSVSFSTQTTTVAYLVLYFRDPISRFPQDPKGQVEVLVNDQKLGTAEVPPYYRTKDMYSVVSLYPVEVRSSANVTILAAPNSTLAPLLNAMEVYSVVNVSDMSHAGYLPNRRVSLGLITLHLFAIIIFGMQL